MASPLLLGSVAVIDLETTGLFPGRHDRVLEVAAVVVGADGRIEREFVSLVNPARDIGPSSIHGLTSEDIIGAPQFQEIVALLMDTLAGCVAVAGHNVRFDRQFLDAEFSRIGSTFPDCEWVCTMELGWGGSLSACCRDFGIPFQGEPHHALADARAAAHLLVCLLGDQPHEIERLRGCAPIGWPAMPRSGKKTLTRDESRRRQVEPPTYLQRLLDLPHDQTRLPAPDGALIAYTALLDRVLEDRHVDTSEADALVETAGRWGLTSERIRLAHRGYLSRLATAALADGVVTDTERRDLQLVARLLGQEVERVEEVLNEAATSARTPGLQTQTGSDEVSLSGKRVCFTGEMQCSYRGHTISREVAEELATGAGITVVGSVTKKLDLLVVADPHTQSGKAKKARQYGIRVMHEPVFWKALGVTVT